MFYYSIFDLNYMLYNRICTAQKTMHEPCMVRATLIDLNPITLKYYSLMVSQDKCSGSCNSGNDLSTKICVLSKTKDMNIKICNLITNRNKAKTLLKLISCDCKCKFNSITSNSNQKYNNKTCRYECKSHLTFKKKS